MTRAQAVGVGVALVAVGYGAGRFATPTKAITVDHVEEVAALRAQVATLTAENTNLKRHTVKTTRVEYAPTGKPTVMTKTEDTHVDLLKGLTVGTVATTAATAAKATTRTETVEHDAPRVRAGLLGDVSTSGRVTATLQGQLRFLGPVVLSGQLGYSPPGKPQDTPEFKAGIGLHWDF